MWTHHDITPQPSTGVTQVLADPLDSHTGDLKISIGPTSMWEETCPVSKQSYLPSCVHQHIGLWDQESISN